MDAKILKKQLTFSFLFLLLSAAVFAQKMTTLKGKVVDAETKEPIPFATIAFKSTPPVGTTTDFDGTYQLDWQWATINKVEVSCVGYEPQVLTVTIGEKQTLDVFLKTTAIQIATVEVKAKKGRYRRNEENPAVVLMRKVIENKEKNRIEASAFYEVDRYEKIQFDLNNFDPEKLKSRKAMKPFKIVLDNIDTSEVNGKPYLPFFIQESSSTIYHRREPESRKEHRHGMKVTGMKEYVDDKDLNDMLQVMYNSVNLYQNDIRLLDLSFMSPLSVAAIGYYRFYIIDSTATLNGIPVTKVSFMPENKQNIAFQGDLYITRSDSAYALVKADLGVNRNINVNFVQNLKLQQEFAKQPNGVWARTIDQVVVDFSLLKKGTGFYGTRTAMYRNFVFDKPMPDEYYAGTQRVIEDPEQYKQNEVFWQSARHVQLTQKEQGVYQMIDTLQKLPTFRRTMNVLSLFATGYKAVGPVDVGPIANFYSFNPVEGDRVKLGGETNLKFHPKILIGGYGAYGFKDDEFKYAAYAAYSFREDYKQNPRHYIRAFAQKDVNLVGQILQLNSPDNFFLSFQRGTRDRMLMNNKVQLEYNLETKNHVTYNLTYTNTTIRPIGTTLLAYQDGEGNEALLNKFTTSEVALSLRFAPNEQFIQGRTYRTQLYNKHPIFTLRLAAGMEGVLGGNYTYQSATFGIVKRFYMSFLGNSRLDLEAGKVWSDGLPYFLLHLPKANQSYLYRTNAFNMMNYQEFVSDQYALLLFEHNFNGFILNKLPLLRKLKLRESVTFKTIYGGLSDRNDPDRHPEFIQFQNDEEGRRVNYTLENKPYVETGFGISNIFKVLRIDAIWRLTHLDNPEVPSAFGVKGLGLRGRFKLEF